MFLDDKYYSKVLGIVRQIFFSKVEKYNKNGFCWLVNSLGLGFGGSISDQYRVDLIG